jgi:hypothetical protein
MTFPVPVDEFQRVVINRYDTAGEDVGVGYNLVSSEIAVSATIYAYPAPTLTSIGSPVPGEMAAFKYDDLFRGQRRPLRSELYVHCYVGGKWAFEYRFTYPERVNAISTLVGSK